MPPIFPAFVDTPVSWLGDEDGDNSLKDLEALLVAQQPRRSTPPAASTTTTSATTTSTTTTSDMKSPPRAPHSSTCEPMDICPSPSPEEKRKGDATINNTETAGTADDESKRRRLRQNVAKAKQRPFTSKKPSARTAKMNRTGATGAWNSRGEHSCRYFRLFLSSKTSYQRKILNAFVDRFTGEHSCDACSEWMKVKWPSLFSVKTTTGASAINTVKALELVPVMINPVPHLLNKPGGKLVSTFGIKIALSFVEGGLC